MVARRTSSQKPGDEFIANFRQTFPEVAVATSSAGPGSEDTPLGDAIAGGPHPDRYVDLLIFLGLLQPRRSKRLRASITVQNAGEDPFVLSELCNEFY